MFGEEMQDSNVNQVAIISLMVHIPSNAKICCCVTHLKAKPDFEELRVKEIILLLQKLKLFVSENNIDK
eukprot:Pgem_evm2s302